MAWLILLCLLSSFGNVHANPAAEPIDRLIPIQDIPATTTLHAYPTKVKRGVDDVVNSLLGGAPSEIADGVANFFQGFPTGAAVQSSLGLDDSQVAALPTSVLNLPPYGNYTNQGWNVRFRGNVYKLPQISRPKLDDLTDVFLPDVDVKDLPADQAAQARNLTSSIFVIQQEDENVTMLIMPGASDSLGNGVVNAIGVGSVTLPYPTTEQGDYDEFVALPQPVTSGLQPGNATKQIQVLSLHVNGTDSGNATAYMVPDEGFTIISDIDDILRVTKIYQPQEGLLNSFARPFTPWMNMPEIYEGWSKSIPDFHFHYLTTTPEQVTRTYMEYIFKTYPAGSFDTRPLNFSDVSATLSIRRFLLGKIFQTFPRRKFVLMADTSNSDVLKAYPGLVQDFPGQVQCIFLRNTSATDSDNKFPYNTAGFKDLNQNMYMFFTVPDDLKGLDIAGGQCYNSTVKQNLTFGIQGLPFGIDLGPGPGSPAPRTFQIPTTGLVIGIFSAIMVFLVHSG